ncbi:MAG: glycosyltransferase [bacterium]
MINNNKKKPIIIKSLSWNPLVSIVIPVYNGSNFLREAIDSALSQTYKNIEIIVINDGSNDDGATEKIALSYGDKIRYFSKKNGGTSTALNLGIKEMRGEYFSWLSHDDLYYPQKISRAIEELSKLKNRDTIIISDLDGMNEDYTRTFPTAGYQQHRDEYPKRNDLWLYPVIYNKTHGCTHLFSKKVFETVGLFDETSLVAHDFEFYYRAFAKFPHLYINEVLITARESSSRQGRRSHTRGNIEYSLLYIDILDHLNDEEILQISPTVAQFFLDMEYFFAYADYSIALDYVEVLAEGKGIKTMYGRRNLNTVSLVSEEKTIAKSAHKTIRLFLRYDIPARTFKAIKKYGLWKALKKIFILLSSKIKTKYGHK